MRLREYQGKQLFHSHGIPLPQSTLLTDTTDLDPASLPFTEAVVKAQVLQGKRKKHGLITTATRDTLQDAVTAIRGKTPENTPILIEEALPIEQEHYLSFSINRAHRDYTLLYSESGGIDIESVDQEHMTQVELGTSPDFSTIQLPDPVKKIAEKLFAVFTEEECLLAEINPLIQTTDNTFVAADSKVILDDNALYRHPDRSFDTGSDATPLEQEAEAYDLEFVELDGSIGVIGNGAGLVLATLDMIDFYGSSPANFLDIGGGADTASMQHALDIVLEQNPPPKGVFINIFGGITHCDLIAEGIVEYLDDHHLNVPVVVRMIGTNQEKGRRILEDNGIHALSSMEGAAEKIVELVNQEHG